jgi:hypothetical protein
VSLELVIEFEVLEVTDYLAFPHFLCFYIVIYTSVGMHIFSLFKKDV